MAPQNFNKSKNSGAFEAKDMLDKLEDIEEEGFAEGVDALQPSDVKNFHENLVKTLDFLVM